MKLPISIAQLTEAGLMQQDAEQLHSQIESQLQNITAPEEAWQITSRQLLNTRHPFTVHLLIFSALFPAWRDHPESAPAYLPTTESISSANIANFMIEKGHADVKTLQRWTVTNYEDFWRSVLVKLNIIFKKQPDQICDLSHGIESPSWLRGAKLNIVDSCFTAQPDATAIVYEDTNKKICKLSYRELNNLTNRIANSLIKLGLKAGDAIGIAMPMNIYAVAIYLGIIRMGGVVVSIADSFSSQEMAVRLKIAKAKAIFTQDFINWGGKKLPLHEKIQAVETPWTNEFKTIVLPCDSALSINLRQQDIAWDDFLSANTSFTSVACDPMTACNILFSSGTTAEPKAIVWNHTTPIKAASDAYFHQNIQPGDVMAWPTNLGWMMGPWLVYAALINHAAIALYPNAPKDRPFGEYISRAQVTMLGVVPTLVATWRQSKCMEGLDWRAIKTFSSTGECSNAEDMLYLMSLAGYKPVLEYCGGTEIGGSYISSTVIEKNYPSLFTTPAMGIDFVLLDESGRQGESGEVAIIPPSIGLSTELLNANHHQIYFTDMPTSASGKKLRRHGDQIKRLPGNFYSVVGRVDDAMNLGGIKVSAAEIERVLAGSPQISEVAAIAIAPLNNGPSQLVIYAATSTDPDKKTCMKEMQKKINAHLNPLFKIHDLIFVKDLPKTASNKIMRRVLRKSYMERII